MKIAVIGAGISGLSIARMLREDHQVTVYERDSLPGGLVKCRRIDGNLFHTTGGHVFNTKKERVLKWFWQIFDKDNEFVKADRNSVIHMPDGRHVSYPIENHAYQLDEVAINGFVADLISMAQKPKAEYTNFKDFLIATFGPTLYDLYFRPYNEKVWRCDLSDVPISWLEGKLPMPSLHEMLYNNFKHVEEKAFVHSTFYYPKCGGSQFIANRLAEGSDIRYDSDIHDISYEDGAWHIGDEVYDRVIFSGNVKSLPSILKGIDISKSADQIDSLASHGTTTVLCEIDTNPYSWVYLPDKSYDSHRVICTGNFSPSNTACDRLSATIEFTDYISKDGILEQLNHIPFAPRYLEHNYAQYTYPIQTHGTRELINDLKSQLNPYGFYLLGRFAEWEYYNMDAAMDAAFRLYDIIK